MDLMREFTLTAFFPFRVFRLTPEQAVFGYLPTWTKLMAGIAVGVPLILTVIAVRRYFTLTHDN